MKTDQNEIGCTVWPYSEHIYEYDTHTQAGKIWKDMHKHVKMVSLVSGKEILCVSFLIS